MTDTPSLTEAQTALERLAAHRRELRDRQAALQRDIEAFSHAADQADIDERIRAIMRGDHGAGERRSLSRLLDDASQVADQLRLVERAVEQQKEIVAAARRRHARGIAVELGPEYDAIATRIASALEGLAAAQADERELHARIRQASGVEGVLPELGRPIPGLDHLRARVLEHLATRARAAA